MIASTLLGVDPPRLPALALVRSGEHFGLTEGATRTALSRMAANDEVVAADGHYSLAGPLLERHGRQQTARTVAAGVWDGTWIAALVVRDRRSAADRAAFRDAASRLKLAEIREGVWMRPDDRDPTAVPGAAETVEDQATWLRGIRPDDIGTLVERFELDTWAVGARALVDEMRARQSSLDQRQVDVLGETFVIAADVLRHLVADPDLPAPLLTDDWPGPALRGAFAAFDAAFKDTWRTWYQSFQDP